jgi:DNA-binding NarL/FixJ family response regulator
MDESEVQDRRMRKKATVLIAVRPGSLSTGLQALLSSIPVVQRVEVVSIHSNVLKEVAEVLPDLLIVEAGNFTRKAMQILADIRGKFRDVRSIVIVQGSQPEAGVVFSDADEVVLEGTAPDALVKVIERVFKAGDA